MRRLSLPLASLPLLTLALSGCPGPEEPTDAGVTGLDTGEPQGDAGEPQDAFSVDAEMHEGLRLPRCEETDPAPATPLPHFASTLEATIAASVLRPAMAGPLNPAAEDGELMYRGLGYHEYEVSAGLDHVQRADLGGTFTSSDDRRSLAWFAQLSDFQLSDDESPTRLASLDNTALPGGLRAQEAYLPRAVSAMNRTFARLASEAGRPLDFGIVTGDCSDSAQANELSWVIQLMNGGAGLETDSGEDNDPVPGPDNDPKDPFDPVAFPAPWLYVPGNHDVLVMGINLPAERSRAQAIGTTPTGGTRDYRLWYAPVTRRAVPADPERRLLDRDEIIQALRETDADGPSGPPGHGYPTSGDVDTALGANYAFDAIPGLLRVLTLDTNDPTGGSEGLVMRETVNEWLIPELERATDDGVLVILASHHSMRNTDVFPGQLGTEPLEGAVPGEELDALVASYPAVIAWLVGHVHDNQIRAVRGADAEHPGFWEIMTSAIADYPSQARSIELVDNGDGTLSIFATIIDYDTDDCFERRFRALTQMEWLSGWSGDVTSSPTHLNVELLRTIPASAAAAVDAASTSAPSRIESLTTLRGE